ncbi:MAG TPA: hypothetical protein VGB52_14500 [Actinomycetota bacterium]
MNPRRMLVALGAAYLVAQLALLHMARIPTYDEAVYISQVSSRLDAIRFSPHRARGIVVLIAPVTLLGASGWPLHVFLAVVSSAGLVAAFWPWIRALGSAAPIAALIFASTWLGLFYGSAAMPNLPEALLAVGAAGLIARGLDNARRDVWLGGGILALAGLFRPTDAIAVGAGLVVATLLLSRRARARTITVIVLAVVVGWVPWTIESFARLDGPVAALREAQQIQETNIGPNIREHLEMTDGPLVGPARSDPIPPAGVAWWTAIAALTIVGLAASRKDPVWRPAVLATVVAAAAAAPYLLIKGPSAPRFLLPAYGLVALPMALGLLASVRWASARIGRAVAVAGVALLALVWLVGHAAAARVIQQRKVVEPGIAFRAIGEEMRERAGGVPCSFASSSNHPQISFVASCGGRALRPTNEYGIDERLRKAAEDGERVYLTAKQPATEPPFSEWVWAQVADTRWWIAEPAGQARGP